MALKVRRILMTHGLIGVVVSFGGIGVVACQGGSPFSCTSDAQCSADVAGVCQPSGYCSFPSSACPSGQQYGGYSGMFSDQCVELTPSTSSESATGVDGSGSTDGEGISPGTTMVVGDSDGAQPTHGEESTAGASGPDDSSGSTGLESGGDETTSGSTLDPDLVLWLEFSSRPDFDLSDSSLSQSEIICGGTSCPVSSPGLFGSSAAFDGNDDVLIVPHAQPFETTREFTISIWIWLDTQPAPAQSIIAKPVGTANLNTWELWFSSEPAFRFNMHVGGEGNPILVPGPYPIDRWVHVAGSWDGTTETLWFDGEARGSKPVAGIEIDDNPIYVGADDNHQTNLVNHFEGRIDDVRVYRRALTGEEIVALEAEGRGG